MTVDPGMPNFGTVGSGNPRGICRVCGEPAAKKTATLCVEHGGQPKKADAPKVTTTAAPDGLPKVEFDADGTPKVVLNVPPASKAPAKGQVDKAARATELEASILKLNPMLVQGFAIVCKPIDASFFYTLDIASGEMSISNVGAQILITPWEAQLLGKALAEVEDSPVLKMATGAIGPVIPVMYLAAAVGVVGYHGYKLAGLRSQLMLQVQQQNPYGGPVGVVSDQEPTGTEAPGQGSSPVNGWATSAPFDPSVIGTPQL